MPTYSPEQALARPSGRAPLWGEGLLAAALWLLGGLFTLTWPDAGRRWPFSEGWALAQFTLGGGLLLLALSYRYWRARGARVLHAGKWLALLPVLFAVWEGLTAKTAVLPVPFFAPPQALIEVLHDDWPRLLDSLLHSLGLLGLGVLLGTSSGFITGLAIGWSQRIGYWVHPVLRLLGPVPSTALLPLCLFIFPSSFGASVFLIALSTWFPVTVLTWSGVMGIDKAWYDVARTLGASQRFPDPAGGDPCRVAERLCRPVYGARRVVFGADCRRNGRGEVGDRLLPPVGPGLGGLS